MVNVLGQLAATPKSDLDCYTTVLDSEDVYPSVRRDTVLRFCVQIRRETRARFSTQTVIERATFQRRTEGERCSFRPR